MKGRVLIPIGGMLLNDELISTISLIVLLVMFLIYIHKEAEKHGSV